MEFVHCSVYPDEYALRYIALTNRQGQLEDLLVSGKFSFETLLGKTH